MSFMQQSAMRLINPNETASKAPLNQELMSQIRKNLESLLLTARGTGIKLRVNSAPTAEAPNTLNVSIVEGFTAAIPEDKMADWDCVVLSGFATATKKTITKNGRIDAPNSSFDVTFVDDGSPLHLMGIVGGDYLTVLYAGTMEAHTHDGTDSPTLSVVSFLGEIPSTGLTLSIMGGTVEGSVETDTVVLKKEPGQTAVRCQLMLTTSHDWSYFQNINLWAFIEAGEYGSMDMYGQYTEFSVPERVYSQKFECDIDNMRSIDVPHENCMLRLPPFMLSELGIPDLASFRIGVHLYVAGSSSRTVNITDLRLYSGVE